MSAGRHRPALSLPIWFDESTTMMGHAVTELVIWLTRHESGQDLLEYALLVGLIALVAVGAITTVGTTIQGVFWTYISGVMGAL
jgi:pilus assembly protein Flp/PilA